MPTYTFYIFLTIVSGELTNFAAYILYCLQNLSYRSRAEKNGAWDDLLGVCRLSSDGALNGEESGGISSANRIVSLMVLFCKMFTESFSKYIRQSLMRSLCAFIKQERPVEYLKF